MTNQTKNRHNSIIYKTGDIVKDINVFINNKSRQGFDILLPQCISHNINIVSKLTQQIYSIFPELKTNTEIFVSNPKNYGHTQFVSLSNRHNKNLNKIVFANMICTKQRYHQRKIDYILLAKCMSDVSSFIKNQSTQKENDKIYIMASKFGTGFLGGNWSFIEQLIHDSWDGFTTTIYNYDHRTK